MILNDYNSKFPYDTNINDSNNINTSVNLNEQFGGNKYNKKSKINKNDLTEILIKINKNNLIDELAEDRLGKKIIKDIELNGSIPLLTILNWVFFVQNAFKFIDIAKNYFEEIYLSEHIENNFLFKLKKGPNTKSIVFFFFFFEKHKEECFVI